MRIRQNHDMDPLFRHPRALYRREAQFRTTKFNPVLDLSELPEPIPVKRMQGVLLLLIRREVRVLGLGVNKYFSASYSHFLCFATNFSFSKNVD